MLRELACPTRTVPDFEPPDGLQTSGEVAPIAYAPGISTAQGRCLAIDHTREVRRRIPRRLAWSAPGCQASVAGEFEGAC
jgi:hypothetical protein